MKLRWAVPLLVVIVMLSACSMDVTTSVTFGVDDAPQLVKSAYLTVSRHAARLAGHEVSSEEWMELAREVCEAGIENSEDLSEFVKDRAGSGSDPAIVQMWSTATNAATTSFCPIGQT